MNVYPTRATKLLLWLCGLAIALAVLLHLISPSDRRRRRYHE